MAEKNTAVATDALSDAAAKALETSGQPLGGQVSTDEDDLFAEMMAEADAEADLDASDLFED